ncbi:Lung surfactant protein D coiled-coil trimerization domain-containing protein [Dioscorea alata]|uniref:Lung surfactant protein D coiled-coil trimerization domain-containing protein n=1 Tax=Dioscorea alata TaxID=55571 RepID=A0ACB7WU73_DIOAL|nr:Lung surfactant protein D coiled-coil trimerization domain-containing protein [Dioscorea alata]
MASRCSSRRSDPSPSSSKARHGSSDLAVVAKTNNSAHLGTMLKKLIDSKKSNSKQGYSDRMALPITLDPIAGDLKKVGWSKGSSFTALHRKLFQKGGSADRKVLTEVMANARTLAMVLRSERELMDRNQEFEAEVSELQSLLEEKDREKLRDLCLKQRKEIKVLKDAILFPDEMNSQLQVMLDDQGSELKHAKKLIPSLQKQVSSLTGQLQCLAEDLAEFKADKYAVSSCFDGRSSSPRTPILFKEAANSLVSFDSAKEDGSFLSTTTLSPDTSFNSSSGILSKSSEYRRRAKLFSATHRIHR